MSLMSLVSLGTQLKAVSSHKPCVPEAAREAARSPADAAHPRSPPQLKDFSRDIVLCPPKNRTGEPSDKVLCPRRTREPFAS